MKIRILPSSSDAPDTALYLTAFVVDARLAVDAGSLGICGQDGEFLDVAEVLLTHSHADHVASLPLHIERRFAARQQMVTVRGNAATIDSLRRDVFNDRVWPDLVRISSEGPASLMLQTLEPERAVPIAGLTVTPVPVDHTVPTFGYVIDDGRTAVVFGGDSGPTERLWEVASGTGRLRAAFLETSFPDRMAEHAALTHHLTPRLLAGETEKLPADVAVVAVHIKPDFRTEIEAELHALGSDRITVGRAGTDYSF